jgi:hypothetical protein
MQIPIEFQKGAHAGHRLGLVPRGSLRAKSELETQSELHNARIM